MLKTKNTTNSDMYNDVIVEKKNVFAKLLFHYVFTSEIDLSKHKIPGECLATDDVMSQRLTCGLL